MPVLDSVYLSPLGNVLVSDDIGMKLYDQNMKFLRQLTVYNGHKCLVMEGSEEVMIVTNAADPTPGVPQNALMKVPLSGAAPTPIVTFGWWPDQTKEIAVHITASAGKVLFEAYSPRYTGGPRRTFDGGIWQLPLDGSQPIHICDHGSSGKDYQSQPRVSISQDGSRAFWNSDVAGRPDVYMVELDSPPPTPIGSDLPFISQDDRPTLKPNSQIQWYRPSSGEDGLLRFDGVNYRFDYSVNDGDTVKVRINP